MHINSFNYLVSGTEFGLLNLYQKANFYDGFLFSDFKGNANITYSNEVSGGTLINEFGVEDIPTNNIIFWLDASDSSTVTMTNTGGIMSIDDIGGNLDSSNNPKVFKPTSNINPVLTAYWPIFDNGLLTDNVEISTNIHAISSNLKTCFLFTQNAFLQCSGFFINFNNPFTIFMVWYDKNTSFKTIPFSLKTEVNGLTTEFIAHNDYLSEPHLKWGTRGTGSLDPAELPIGFKVTPLSSISLFNIPNITKFNSPGIVNYEDYVLGVDNTRVIPDGPYFHSYYINTQYSSIGYVDDENNNNFYFGEMIVFEGNMSKTMEDNIFNYLAKKWFMYGLTRQNAEFSNSYSLCGGKFDNTYYEDISLKESFFNIPIQACTTKLTLILSAFDETVSDIKEVECVYRDQHYKIETPLNVSTLSAENLKLNRKIDILLNPEGKNHRSTYSIFLSVYKYDTTINKITLSGEILKCGILDMYYDNYLLDTQLGSNSNNVYILNEDRKNKQLYINTLDTDVPDQILSGGDIKLLQNDELIKEAEITLTLAELLGIVKESKYIYTRPVISPIANPNINPVLPSDNIK
jgi:hypothetical protein